ncbi:MAG: N-acetyltransferase, partial [Proteobacteria bacterium]
MRETDRLHIRALVPGDYENWQQAYSMLKPAKNKWDESPWKLSELTKLKFCLLLATHKKLRASDDSYWYGIFRNDDGVLLGMISLMDISRNNFQNAYIGYRIFNNYWGQGYATEACRATLDVGFKELKLHRIEAGIEPANKVSIKVAKAIGLR